MLFAQRNLRFAAGDLWTKIELIITSLLLRSRRSNRKTKIEYEDQHFPHVGFHVGGNYDRGGHYRALGRDRYPQLRQSTHHLANERVHQQSETGRSRVPTLGAGK